MALPSSNGETAAACKEGAGAGCLGYYQLVRVEWLVHVRDPIVDVPGEMRGTFCAKARRLRRAERRQIQPCGQQCVCDLVSSERKPVKKRSWRAERAPSLPVVKHGRVVAAGARQSAVSGMSLSATTRKPTRAGRGGGGGLVQPLVQPLVQLRGGLVQWR